MSDEDWYTVVFSFMKPGLLQVETLIEALDAQKPNLVGVADSDLYEEFFRAATDYAWVARLRSVSAVVVQLTRIANERIALEEGWDSDQEWVKFESVFGSDAVPASVAQVLMRALDKMRAEGDVDDEKGAFRLLEHLAAEYLAGSQEVPVTDEKNPDE